MRNIKFFTGDVVQFIEGHKWCGCLGIIEDIDAFDDGDVRYLINVPNPERAAYYIFSMQSACEFELIGRAVMVSTLSGEDV